MRRIRRWILTGMLIGALSPWHPTWSQDGPGHTSAKLSKAQEAIERLAEEGKFAFVVFYKEDSPDLRTMSNVVAAGVKQREEKAAAVHVQVTNPAERALVDRHNLGRAPMPLTLVLAPTGAVTGIFAKEITDEKIDEALVTPAMTHCMKSLQEQKLVFVCLTQLPGEKAAVPTGVRKLQSDPQFKDRIKLVSVSVKDPAEARFVKQMNIDSRQVLALPQAVLLAPPGLLIGQYGSDSGADEIAAAIHKAGKCCDDVNCKHNRAAQPTAKSATRRK